MFRGLINDAKSAAGAVVAKYAARASVAVPFLVALGFATAALTLTLADALGSIAAYWMVAGGFTAIGLVAAAAVTAQEQDEAIADEAARSTDNAAVASNAAAQAIAQAPLALLGALMTTTGGPAAAMSLIRALGRNLPLVLLLVMISVLFLPDATPERSDAEEDLEAVRPNGARSPSSGIREHV